MKTLFITAVTALILLFGGTAKAQIPTTDVLLNAQFGTHSVSELASLAKQLTEQIKQYQVMYNQLTQAQQAYQAIMGGRGMDLLLGGQLNAYLPPSMQSLTGMAQTARYGFGGVLAGGSAQQRAMSAVYGTQSILSSPFLATLDTADRQAIYDRRDNSAIAISSAQAAYDRAANRIANLQGMQTALRTATDPAAKSELQTAIAIEQAMIQNDQIQLQALGDANRAEQLAMSRRLGEREIVSIGSYSNYRHPDF